MNLKALRKKYPDQKWTAHQTGFGSWSYSTESGWLAHWVAALTGDEDRFDRQFWVYFNDGRAPERLDTLSL